MPKTYYETLPSECPPSDATTVNNEVFYRIIDGNPAVDTDFHSHKKLGKWKAATAQVKDECIACAVSLWKDLQACKNIQLLPKNKNKKIAAIKLTSNDGVVKQTMRENHYSWWRSDKFTINNSITYH